MDYACLYGYSNAALNIALREGLCPACLSTHLKAATTQSSPQRAAVPLPSAPSGRQRPRCPLKRMRAGDSSARPRSRMRHDVPGGRIGVVYTAPNTPTTLPLAPLQGGGLQSHINHSQEDSNEPTGT